MKPSHVLLLSAAGLGLLLYASASSSAATESPKPPQPPVPPTPRPSAITYPVGTIVDARINNNVMTGLKIIDNRPNFNGDYQVIEATCVLPQALCTSYWIRKEDIL